MSGVAPAALRGLPTPHAIFVGEVVTEEGLIDFCWEALSDRGRLVVHATTAQTETFLREVQAKYGGDLTRISIERLAPSGSSDGTATTRAVTQWSVIKRDDGA